MTAMTGQSVSQNCSHRSLSCVVFCVVELPDALSDASSSKSPEVVLKHWAKDPTSDEKRTKKFYCIDLLLYNAVLLQSCNGIGIICWNSVDK